MFVFAGGKEPQIWPISWLNLFFPPQIRMIKHHKLPGLGDFLKKTGETLGGKTGEKTPDTLGPEGQCLERRWLVTLAPRRLGALRWEDLEGLGAPTKPTVRQKPREIAGDDGTCKGVVVIRLWWNLRCPDFKYMDVFDAYGNYLSIELCKSLSD